MTDSDDWVKLYFTGLALFLIGMILGSIINDVSDKSPLLLIIFILSYLSMVGLGFYTYGRWLRSLFRRATQ